MAEPPFVDEAVITVIGGDGGNGCLSFRREKYEPRGGPNGGDGGHGGSVELLADINESTLLAFRFNPRFKAERGRHGQGANKTGRSGRDLVVRVPVGTRVCDEDDVRLLCDLARPGQRYLAAQGGRGGRGNARFATSTHRAPTRHDPGEPGQARVLRLELRLLADVGLVGLPNAGKSTLISRISAARPKIADYPFTTLAPHLGVVDAGDYRSFVVADIPGLIEGAHRGAGIGYRFLRHVERCEILLHLVDPVPLSGRPLENIEVVNRELERYSPKLAAKPQIVVITKMDVGPDAGALDELRAFAQRSGLRCLAISAVAGRGLDELVRATLAALDERRAQQQEPVP